MQHFFVTEQQVEGGRIRITGSDVRHIRSALRMREKEQVKISDGNNRTYLCEIESFADDAVICRILKSGLPDTELSSRIVLFQALPKADKMDLIVQKAVELGVSAVVPVATKRAVVRLDEKRAEKKVQRWNSVARSACKQAGRSRIPEVTGVVGLSEALSLAGSLDHILFPYELAEGMEHTREVISSIKKGESVGVFIGPEGGFSREEVDMAARAGAVPLTLGKRILRTETAGLCILSVLMFHLEE